MLSYNVPKLAVCLCKSKSPTESRYFVCWTDGEKETRRVKHNDKLCAERKRNIRTNATKTINNSFFVNDLRWCCFFSTEHIRQSIHSTYCESAETIVMRMHVPFLRRSLLPPFSVFQLRLSTSSLAATVHKTEAFYFCLLPARVGCHFLLYLKRMEKAFAVKLICVTTRRRWTKIIETCQFINWWSKLMN